MGKGRNQAKPVKSSHQNNSARAARRKIVIRRQHSQTTKQSLDRKTSKLPTGVHSRKSQNTNDKRYSTSKKVKIPFSKNDNVLLVGEGNFSFALSLTTHYTIKSLLATCFDSKEVLLSKYPEVESTIAKLEALDLRKVNNDQRINITDQEEWQGFSPDASDRADDSDDANGTSFNSTGHVNRPVEIRTYYNIDATKLNSLHKKAFKSFAPFTRIVFNFPHVGGISTDVNRQVRANQELLVGFFNAAKTMLATPTNPVKIANSFHKNDVYASSEGDSDEDDSTVPSTYGSILISLFEGEPYTLWNIRDLARHCGLKVVESFPFPWAAYPEYQHARTVGDITHGQDRSHEGKRKGAWRGEERDARCYVLTLKDAEGPYPAAGMGQKRKKEAEDDDTD